MRYTAINVLCIMQNSSATLGDRLAVSYKNKHTLTVSSNYTSWYLYKKLKTYVLTITCTWIFLAALFLSAKNWKQPRWRNKLVHTDNGILLNAKKK